MNTPWVLLRGLTRSARHWGDFPGRLQAKDHAVVLTPELPGNGARWRERSPMRIESIAADCRAGLLRSGHPPPYRVLALSMGAMVATAWAHAAPRDIERLVLVNTSLRPYAPMHWRMRPGNFARVLRLLLSSDAALRERGVLAMTSRRRIDAGDDASALLHEWIDWQQQEPVSRANAWRQIVAAARYRAPGAPAVPVELVASRGDALVDVRCSRSIAAAWSCPLHEHPSAGHDLPLDDPAWLLTLLV